ncbi:alpha-L-arabinofuranosidase C-terminal domain-containing protein [Ferruginibacter paludis]|uniref:alpha-L-arabinofuranosidase C-terminal domain-containing protein n=1 Tax=Ferruginibacter paludis TaxID=1310417 RepID=UPI0025B481FE|nr:alpha-L-arabinofuranosidase C-terminal domain-containing protein [Ferruginibacter paludis]MDN3655704.1 alpha-L-arabinofuranosidase C-terminal domain-containing protein [Ferruginibacter paludis]
MRIKKLLVAVSLTTGSLLPSLTQAQNNSVIAVQVNKPIADVQPTMWGVFFEDINLGADGGIYAELVKNRSFEFYQPLMGWKVTQNKFNEGSVLVVNREEKNTNNPRFIRITKDAAADTLGISNEGFRGMGIKKGLRYDFSVLYRQQTPGLTMHAELVSTAGKVIGSTTLQPSAGNGDWSKAAVSFNATDTSLKASFNIWFEGTGKIDLDMISLFPEDTWKKRPGGMRADMIQLLADMKPGFIRFPGGCIVEGHELSTRYQWKKTIGPVEERQLSINRWNGEFAHRPTPDYFQTFGLGFFEYFQLAEDIGAAPLPILNCGMACQFNTAEVIPIDQLDPYVQDALDLIEFANGDATTQWGKVRTQMGHPAPFNLKMMGVGNENWGPQYVERLKIFSKAIKARYPDFKLVNSSGTDPNGDRFDYLNGELRKMNADIIDEHYYRRPEWFLANAARYDNYPRNASKIFAGEYAAQSDKTVSIDNRNNTETAIAEAAFMTGLERNAAVVNMASYAPLFAHIDGWQWTPDLIWVNNLQSYGTPNYYVQKLYSTNKGTNVVPALMEGKSVSGQDSLYVSAVTDKNTNDVIIKVVNASAKPINKAITINGVKKLNPAATVTVLKGNSVLDVNSFANPEAVSPATSAVQLKGNKLAASLPAYSFSVYRIGMK